MKNYQIWIGRDNTEKGIATEFEDCGIIKQQIVLGFYPLEQRQNMEDTMQQV
jgi:hypothetical protein